MIKLDKGLFTDCLPIDQPQGTWRNARNKVFGVKKGAISVEDGLKNITPEAGGAGTAAYPSNKHCIGTLLNGDEKIVFLVGTSAVLGIPEGEIGKIKSDGLYYPIVKDVEGKIVLNFDFDYPIQAVCEKKFNGNTIVCWVAGNDEIKLLNIDCLPFGLDPDFTVKGSDILKARALLKLFIPTGTPTLPPYDMNVLDGQGSLTSGAVYPFIQYESADGTFSLVTKIFNGIPIYATSLTSGSRDVSGGEANETTTKAIELNFTNVDTNYKKLRVGYLSVNGGVTKAYVERSFSILTSSVRAIITGGTRTEVDLDEILVPNKIYKRAKTVAKLQKVLYLGNVQEREEYNFQRYANLITINWIREKSLRLTDTVVGSTTDIGTHQSPVKVFYDKSFKSGECYAFYFVPKYKDGTYGKAFHIPGRQSAGTDKDILNPVVGVGYESFNAIDSNNPIYKYQIFNTHTETTQTKGAMGYWENENEMYPLSPDGTAVHEDFSNIPGVTTTDATRRVRHHVFPDLSYLDNGTMLETFLTGSMIGSGGAVPVGLNTKVFGIEVSNVNIPAEIAGEIDSWEIHYAERNNSNIRVIGNDCFSESSTSGSDTYYYCQQFDLMVSRANLIPTYIKNLLYYKNNGASAGNEWNFTDALHSVVSAGSIANLNERIANVRDFIYLGENVSIPYVNTGRAEDIILKTINNLFHIHAPLFHTAIDTANPALTAQWAVLFDMCIYKRDMYLDFSSQTLVSTGYNFKVFASGVQSSQKIYGGDIYINRHDFNPLNSGNKPMSFVLESASNIGLRREDFTLSKFFYPKYPTTVSPGCYFYNTDYTCINKFNQLSVHYPAENCTDGDVVLHEHRIPFSIKETTEGSSINWRIFKANSYHDSAKDKGEIWNLLGSDRELFIHHKYALIVASIKDSFATGDEEVALGVSDIFDRPPKEVIPVDGGYAGTQSQFACIHCKLGYCFIDKTTKKIFIYNSQTGLKEISDQGMYKFFEDNVLSETDITSGVGSIDNPFMGEGYLMGYDYAYDRLIITKRATELDEAFEFTLSYSPQINNGQGGWVSFHDFLPGAIFSSRDGLYTIFNPNDTPATNGKVFFHNDKATKAMYYEETIKESYIEVCANSTDTLRFDNINWIASSELNGVIYPQDSYSHLIVYSDNQCSGKIDLSAKSSAVWYSTDKRNVEGTWNFNNFRDVIVDSTLPFFDRYRELIGSNISTSKSWYKQSQFISKYAIFRLISDNEGQKELHLSSIGINFKKSPR